MDETVKFLDQNNLSGRGSRNPSNASEEDALGFNIEELDDKEYELPAVQNPPTLESILNEAKGGSLSDEEVSTQVGAFFQETGDSMSVSSADSKNILGEKKARKSSHYARHDSIMRHVVLRGVSSQLQSAAQRVDSGKPTALAVSSVIAVGTFHGLVLVFDPEQALKWCLGSRQLGEQYGSVSALGFNSDCTRLLCGYAKGQLTMWDLTSGKLLRTITDIHPPQTAILHVKFTDDPTLAICSDSGGSVFELNFRKVLNNRTCESVCIFSGSRGEVCAVEPLRVGQEIRHHPAHDVSLLALGTVTKVIVVTVRPILRVRFTHPLKANSDTLPLLSWQFVVIQVSAATRIIDPVLAFGRQNLLFFFQVNISSPDKILFVPLQKIELQYTVQNFTWLNSRTLAALDTSEDLHILDVRSQEELETLDMADVQMVYGTSHFKGHATGGNVSKAMATAGERACYHSVAGFGSQVLFLGVKSIHVLTLRTWLERIDFLCKQNLYPDALALAYSFYNDEAKAVSGLVGKKAHRQQQVARKMEELLTTFAELLMTRLNPDHGRLEVLLAHYAETVPLCVRYCLAVEFSEELFEKLYSTFGADPLAKGCFLESLPQHILDGRLSRLGPQLAKEFVQQLASKQQFETLESCLVRLDIACLDIHQVMTLCWTHCLYDGIIYVYNRGMNDYTTPIKELMAVLREALKHGKQLTDNQMMLGNKLLVYVSCCLAGRGYPHGDIDPLRVTSVKTEVFQCVTALHGADANDDSIFPYLKALLHFSTREFLNVLALAFEEEEFTTESGLAQKQRVVDILLQIMVQSEGFSPTEVGALFTFLARQLARPDNTLIVNRLLFEQVLEYLTNPDDETRMEERQQALLELLQAGGFVGIEDGRLLQLSERAKFYRVCEYLYEKRRQYDKIFLCYLEDPSRKPRTFYYAMHVFDSPNISEQEKTLLENQLIESIEELLDIDNTATSQLMLQYLAHRVDDVMWKLEGRPEVLYQFLQGVWNSREFQSSSAAQGLVPGAKDSRGLAAEVQEKYIDLMCRFEPTAVHQFIASFDGYRLEETLEICRRNKVLDATAYLLERTGDIPGAFSILLEVLREKLSKYAKLKRDVSRKTELDAMFDGIDAQLSTVVQLCQRSSSKMDAAEREALWFPLLEVVMEPQRELRKLLGPEQLDDFQALTHHLLGSMMGFVALPHILHKLMQDPVYSSGKFGEVRDFIMKMLDTHNYEKALLNTTNRLLNCDLHLHLHRLKLAANRGYASHTASCCACNKSFATGELDDVVMFRCCHCYHRTCLEASRSAYLGTGGKVQWYCFRCFRVGKKPPAGFSKRVTDTPRTLGSSSEKPQELRLNREPQAEGPKPLLNACQLSAIDYLRNCQRTKPNALFTSMHQGSPSSQVLRKSSLLSRDDLKLHLSPARITSNSFDV
ncbi:unnamed protein product [Ixodes hexagonus]